MVKICLFNVDRTNYQSVGTTYTPLNNRCELANKSLGFFLRYFFIVFYLKASITTLKDVEVHLSMVRFIRLVLSLSNPPYGDKFGTLLNPPWISRRRCYLRIHVQKVVSCSSFQRALSFSWHTKVLMPRRYLLGFLMCIRTHKNHLICV